MIVELCKISLTDYLKDLDTRNMKEEKECVVQLTTTTETLMDFFDIYQSLLMDPNSKLMVIVETVKNNVDKTFKLATIDGNIIIEENCLSEFVKNVNFVKIGMQLA